MSSSFNTIRKHTSDPNALRIKLLAQELAKQRSDNTERDLESEDIRSQGRMDHSTIKINDERLKFLTTIPVNNDPYHMPMEPDGDKLKLWLMLDHLGTKVKDASGFGHDGNLHGHPTMHRSNLDMGFMQTSASPAFPAMSFNTALDSVGNPTGEHIQVINHPDIQFSQFSNGFSIAFRFNCVDFSFDTSSGSFNRRFASKQDDTNNHWVVVFDVTGDIDFQVTDGGTLYKRDFDALQLNTWYQVVMTYDPNAGATSADRIKIYVDGVEGSSASGVTLIPPPSNIKNLYIASRTSSTGFFRGFIQDFRIYMDKVLTQSEVTNLNTNELSITDIPKGRVFVINYALINQFIALRKHRYAIGKVVAQRKHRYQITSFLSTTRTHIFDMLEALTTTRTHKFDVTLAITPALRTHKYGLGGNITTTRTHKYDLGGVVTTTRTHKFNLQETLTTTRTHKFNISTTTAKMEYKRFTKSTSLSTPVAQEITFNETPQAIIVWSDGSTADNTLTDNYHCYYGFSDGTRHACISALAKDNLSTSDTFSGHKADKVISMMNTTVGSVSAEADISFSTNKATFNWTTNDSRAVYVHCMAIYNVDDVCVETYQHGTTSSGNKSYNLPTGHTTTTGKFIHTIGNSSEALTNPWNTTFGTSISVGAAVSSSDQWNVSTMSRDGQAASSTARDASRSTTSFLIVHLDDDSITVFDSRAEFVSFGSGTFTINYFTAPVQSTRCFSALVIDDPNIDVGAITEPNGTTGSQNITTATNVDEVKGLMMFNTGFGTLDFAGSKISIGGASGTTSSEQGMISSGETDTSVSSTVTVRLNKTGSVIKSIDPAATATSSTVTSEASVSALGTDQFTLNWISTDGTRLSYYFVIGET